MAAIELNRVVALTPPAAPAAAPSPENERKGDAATVAAAPIESTGALHAAVQRAAAAPSAAAGAGGESTRYAEAEDESLLRANNESVRLATREALERGAKDGPCMAVNVSAQGAVGVFNMLAVLSEAERQDALLRASQLAGKLKNVDSPIERGWEIICGKLPKAYLVRFKGDIYLGSLDCPDPTRLVTKEIVIKALEEWDLQRALTIFFAGCAPKYLALFANVESDDPLEKLIEAAKTNTLPRFKNSASLPIAPLSYMREGFLLAHAEVHGKGSTGAVRPAAAAASNGS